MSDRLKQPPLPVPEPERFRRRQFVAPHRRRALILRLVRPFLMAVAIVGLPSALTGWILFSDQFAVAEVRVSSPERVSTAWAAERLEAFKGRRLFEVGIGDVEAALAGHEWVRGVQLRRVPPGRLEVEILERYPVALLITGGELSYVDANGQVIGSFDPKIPCAELVLLSVPEERADLLPKALGLLETWRRRRLPFAAGLSEIGALSQTDFRVITAQLPYPIFVSTLNLVDGLESLVRYGPEVEERLARRLAIGAVDVRFRDRIVFQPAVPKPHNIEGESNA